ncbi:MAG: S9 family peptidase [Bacteroidota bacterium]
MMTAPKAKQVPHEHITHGDHRFDPYHWLRDKENPEVISYIEEENRYAEAQLSDVSGFKDNLYEELIGRLKKDDSSAPYEMGGYHYYSRFTEEGEYPIFCRKEGSLDQEEEIILDVNKLAQGKAFCQVGSLSISPDRKMLVYAVDFVGRRIFQLYVKNIETGEILEGPIESGTANVVWAEDNQTLFYSVKDLQTLRPYAIKKHRLGSPQEQDVQVFEEKDDTYYVYVGKTRSKQYLMISSQATLSSEVRFISSHEVDADFKVIIPRERKHEYSVAHHGDFFYVLSNEKATNFKVMKLPISKSGKENWEEFIPHREGVLLEDIDVFKDHYVLSERQDGLTYIRIKNWDQEKDEFLEFDDPAYTASVDHNPNFDTQKLRYNYESLTTPATVYEIELGSMERVILKQQEVIGDFDPAKYTSERIFAKAEDGTMIPISLVRHIETDLDGTAPLLQYGYGSYGITVDPYFSSSRLSLLDRGFVFAIAHIRGSSTMGRAWYDNGKLLNKKNTFKDFISCGRHLIGEKYGSPDKLYAMGGSAGGLLMGAVINMAPNLYKGIISAVPFVDVVSTMLDDSIPLTTNEYDEWGNPNDPVFYDYIKSYSPYDNIEAKAYPPMLVLSGLHDSQVQYWEPTKWVARLREMKTDNNVLLLHTNMDAGHGGASGRYEAYKEVALKYVFLLKLAGITA